MLRWVLAALVAANLLFFAFTRGWFDGLLGLHSLGDREPERIAAQVHPENIVLLAAGAASAPSVPSAGSCYETPTYNNAEAAAVETTLRGALPPGTWSEERSESSFGGATVVSRSFRVAAADATLAERLTALKLDNFGRGFTPCASPARGR